MSISITTGDSRFDDLPGRVENFLAQDRIDLVVDGMAAHGYRSPDSPCLWIRDHSDMLRGARYFNRDVTSAVDLFAANQRPNGSIFDFAANQDGRENWTRMVRVPVAADVEYRFVKALFLAWQAGGGDEWAAQHLNAAERALAYSMSHPWRWHEPLGLVKRAYTIDTWDFALSGVKQPWLHFRIDENTLWGIYHCDNSGLFEALNLLARMQRALGSTKRAGELTEQANDIAQRTNDLLWQGTFYRHRHPLTNHELPATDEANQLSLSTPMAINRGLADHARAVAIIDEYQHRRQQNNDFAEWYSIDPPFPGGIFGDEKIKPGAYVNGGIMPLVGGELAWAAFAHGREKYGLNILLQYEKMIREQGASYLWYFPDGSPSTVAESTSPDALPTDGWGSTAMLQALIEGLCGLTDQGQAMNQVELSPRWLAAGIDHAEVEACYTAAPKGCRYTFAHDRAAKVISLTVNAPGKVNLHLLLPPGTNRIKVEGIGEFQATMIEESPYLDLPLPGNGPLRFHLG